MFGNRHKKVKDVKVIPAFLNPSIESNSGSPSRNAEREDEHQSIPAAVTEIMAVVKMNWDFMQSAQFNAIPFALALMDGSSVGSDYQGFLEAHRGVEDAMDLVVDEYYNVFNTSIRRFSSVVDIIGDGQKKQQEIISILEASKETLGCHRYDFLHLWVKHLQYKEMARILDSIVEIQHSIDSLDMVIEQKNYLHAVRLAHQVEKALEGNVLKEIGALSVIKEKVAKTKISLRDVLVDQLLIKLYLGSPETLRRIGEEQQPIRELKFEIEGSPISDKLRFKTKTGRGKLELDEWEEMQSIIEALFHLGELEIAIQFIKERISSDIYNVVAKVIQEVEIEFPSCTDKNVVLEDGVEPPHDYVIIKYFLEKLYEKFYAVLEGHCFVLKVAETLVKLSDVSMEFYSRREVASAIQSEIKALLYDYLSDAYEISNAGPSILLITDMLKGSKQKSRASKQIFFLKPNLSSSLKDRLKQKCGNSAIDSPLTEFPAIEYSSIKDSTIIENGHKLLVPPAISHILVCYQPTIELMLKMELKLGMKLVNFSIFLNDFIMNIYLPLIQDQILIFHHSNINGIDAFQADKTPISDYPLIKSALSMILASHGICRLMETMPSNTDELIKILLQMMKKYNSNCLLRFKSLLRGEFLEKEEEVEESVILSKKWATVKDLIALFKQNTFFTDHPIDKNKNRALCIEETEKEFQLLGERSIHRLELFPDIRRLLHLGYLTFGLEWMLQQFHYLTTFDNQSMQMQQFLYIKSTGILKAFSNLSDDISIADDNEMSMKTELVIPEELQSEFEGLLNSFSQLQKQILYTMRIEIRCHVIYYIDIALREGNYSPEEEQIDPDPYIGILNNELTEIEEMCCQSLTPRKANFLFDGLTQLIDKLLCKGVKMLKRVNKNGVKKLVSNVESIQQNLISFTLLEDTDLPRTKQYFNLLTLDEKQMAQFIQDNPRKFSVEEYQILIDLVFEGKEKQYIMTYLKDYFAKNSK